MRNIHKRYVTETYDEDGIIETYKMHWPDNFNFAYDVVDDIAENDPDRRALIWSNPEGEEHTFTFADIKYYSDKTANYLASLGIKKGDVVLVILRRHYQFWFTIIALHKLGAVTVPATFMLKEHDLAYRFKASGAKGIICTSMGDIADVVDAVADDFPNLTVKSIVNSLGGDEPCATSCNREGWSDFNQGVREASEHFERIETKASDPLLIYFSSGTTGNPKMVLHNGAYPIGHIFTAKHWHNVQSDGVHLTIADTGWGKAVWGKLYGQWFMESCVLAYDFDRFHADEILNLLVKHKVTTLCMPATMYRLLMKEGVEKYDLSNLMYSTTAGEALNPDLFEAWREQTGLTLMEGFGQTETPITVVNSVGMTPKAGSMGKPSPQYDVKIVNEDGEECVPGETGEIVINVNPKPAGIMDEYYLNEEKTKEAMRGGWYHTGDTAWKDEDGYYTYVGRNDDIIKSSGYRIGPFEIESVLLDHPAVLECAVTGVPDDLRGMIVKATIVLHDDVEASDELSEELKEWVKEKTAPYKYPRVIDYVDELPKTVNGKIRRAAIRNKDMEQ